MQLIVNNCFYGKRSLWELKLVKRVLSFAEVSKEKKREERGKGRLGERGRKEEETSAIKPFQDGRRQGVGANFRTT